MLGLRLFSKDYSQISYQTSDDNDSSSDDEKPMLPTEQEEASSYKNSLNRKQFILATLLGSCSTAAVLLILFVVLWRSQLDFLCLQRTSYYSTALKDMTPRYQDVRFNGTLDHPSEYRGAPSSDIDRAWDRLENVRVMSITGDELAKSGFTLDSVRLPEEFGGGYMASVEINHQLHCLNFVRKALHWDYYQYKSAEFTDDPEMVHTHLDHCVEMLRQTLMCHADVGVMSHRWVEHYPNPYPNFNAMHKCRNFEEVLQWTYDQQIPERPEGFRWQPQEGERIWPTPP